MLETLRRIVQEVNAAKNLEQALSIIVTRVKQAMGANVCSVYLTDFHRKEHVLMASDGLNPEAVGAVRLALEEGLVGVVTAREEPLNLDNAPDHPRYRFIAETGEERYHGFLGVPIIHHRRVLGVLVVRQLEARKFDENEVTLLVTIAAQLAGGIAHAEASGGINGLEGRHPGIHQVEGLPGAPGIAVGRATVIYPPADLDVIPDRKVEDVAAEVAVFHAAVTRVAADIEALSIRLRATLPAEDLALFEVYQHMLAGESLVGKTVARIEHGNWAAGALRDTINEHVRAFNAMGDVYLSERASDVRDLGLRILGYLQSGMQGPRLYPERTVIVSEEVSAAMIAEVPHAQLAGVVSVRGSRSSHVAILAHALGVPAVMGARDLAVSRIDGREIVVDGHNGRVYLDPPPALRDEFLRLELEESQLAIELTELRDLPTETPDGQHIPLYMNTGLLADVNSPVYSGVAEGIGLYRTEFPFMMRERFPGEEEQRLIYRQVLESFAPRPVTLRTLDVGGDKALPYFPIKEDNPFLGWRGIRISLDHPEIFLVQLRAMLRASQGLNNLQLLLPMVSTLAEVDDALAFIRRAHAELVEAGGDIIFPKIGVMIEVPSAVYETERIAARVDFISVGSNDLTQYLLAVDRNNARVAGLYDELHPSVLRALMQVVEGAHRHDRRVSVCGEMAGDPAAALLLIGMGMDGLSMSEASLLRIKWVVRNTTREAAHQVLQEVLEMESASSIRAHMHNVLVRMGMRAVAGIRTELPRH